RLPIIGGGTIYTAQFGDAAGLQAGDPVYIAGVEVGRVTAVKLAGDRVRASLRVGNAWLGDQTNAAIEIKSLLGARSVSLDPRGQRVLDPHTPIPLARTASPYDFAEALSGLSGTLQRIDTAQRQQCLQSRLHYIRATPADV